MSSNGVRWDAMARVQRDLLPARDRRELEQAAVPLDPGERKYLLLAPQGWRAVISPVENNGIQVHDIIHAEAIRFLQESDVGQCNLEPRT
jgi:hypothetical protein